MKPGLVVIGASAGGLEALMDLMAALPGSLPVPIVVAQHLAPQHPSMMVELLARKTDVPVRAVGHREKLDQPGILITPPNHDVLVEGDTLVLRPPAAKPGPKPSVDVLFRSVARAFGNQAVAVILSGSGSDGAIGIRSVREAGGVTVAQLPETARYASMPRAAIETGMVGHILRPTEIAALLVALCAGNAPEPVAEPAALTAADPMQRLMGVLRHRTGVDFTGYKRSTLQRRLERRIAATHTGDLAGYLEHLEANAGEALELSRQFLIPVTSFFRDGEVFDTLAAHLQTRLERKGPNDVFRIWSAACSSGEEAFTIAMLAHDARVRLGHTCDIKIFATDVDARAVDQARSGSYPAKQQNEIPEPYRSRFTRVHGDTLQMDADLRDIIVFSEHDLLQDPPFIKLDLITCRNFLIYLSAAAQRQVFETFHYALQSDGLLLLGKSETPAATQSIYQPVAAKQRLYRKVGASRPLAGIEYRPGAIRRGEPRRPAAASAARDAPDLATMVQQALVRTFAPPTVVVDAALRIQYVSGDPGDLMQIGQGPWSPSLLDMLRPDLRVDVQALAVKVRRSGEAAESFVRLDRFGPARTLTVRVAPLPVPDAETSLMLISFVPLAAPLADAEAPSHSDPDAVHAKLLQDELTLTREHLNTVIEELETTNEELQSTNEELQASNEELQSTNEELETTNEELQSTNEELVTVNEELLIKSNELETINQELHGVMEAAPIGLLVLDAQNRVRAANAPARALLKPIALDGKSQMRFADASAGLADLDAQVAAVRRDRIATITSATINHRALQIGLAPFGPPGAASATGADGPAGPGVIVALTDTTSATNTLRKLETLINAAPVPIIRFGADGKVRDANRAANDLYGRPTDGITGLPFSKLNPRRRQRWTWKQFHAQVLEDRVVTDEEHIGTDPDHTVLWTSAPVPSTDGRTTEILRVGMDTTDLRVARGRAAELDRLLAMVSDTLPGALFRAVQDADGDLVCQHQSHGLDGLLGPQRGEAPKLLDRAVPADRSALLAAFARSAETLDWVSMDLRVTTVAGTTAWLSLAAQPRRSDGAVVWDGMILDITEQIQKSRDAGESKGIVAAYFDVARIGMCITDDQGRFHSVNPAYCRIYGYSEDELIGQPFVKILPEKQRAFGQAEHDRFMTDGHEIPRRWVVRRKSGESFPVQVSAKLLVTPDGRRFKVSTVEDLSLIETLTDQLAAAERRAMMENRAQSEFLATMSHELRTPLNAILGFSQIMQMEAMGPLGAPQYKDYVNDILASGEHLLDLIGTIMDIARLDVGEVRLERTMVDLPHLVRAAVTLTARQATNAGVHIATELQPGLPAVRADAVRLRQALVNLLSNAIKFTPSNGSVTVSVARDSGEGRDILLGVRDTGIGMTPEQVDQATRMFWQAERSDSRTSGGVGLGLTIVKSLMAAHGGRLELVSSPGQGTTATLRLPGDCIIPAEEGHASDTPGGSDGAEA